MFKPRDRLDRVFQVGIIVKGINGAAELLGGIVLLFVTPDSIHHLVYLLIAGELSEDPDDFIANRILRTSDGLTGSGLLFGSIYLLVHGTVKVVLVIALLQNRLWAYPWMIGVLAVFIAYQLYRIALSPSVFLIGLTVFDVFIAALTWREYVRQRQGHLPTGDRP